MTMRPFDFRLVLLASSLLALPQAESPAPKPAKQEYTSDFVAFVGADTEGKVIFALDTNRGRDKQKFQAEHFAVLYDEKAGWVELSGNGEYPNPSSALTAIPDSKHYRFEGAPEKGWTIIGAENQVKLAVDALVLRTRSNVGADEFVTRSAAATLTWKQRTLRGRAIYEWTRLVEKNLITDPSTGTFGDGWHGAYLLAGDGGELRAHLTDGDVKELLHERSGFLVTGGSIGVGGKSGFGAELSKLEFEPARWAQGRGFYRWPTRWNLSWGEGAAKAKAVLSISHRENIANWGVGAFGVAVVEGEIEVAGVKTMVWGLGQIVR